MKRSGTLLDDAEAGPRTHPEGGLASPNRNPTTSFLTATTLIYAIGAGITAAAGTRLALQLILVKVFKFYSFQLQDMDVLYCDLLVSRPSISSSESAIKSTTLSTDFGLKKLAMLLPLACFGVRGAT